jgi:tRNA nucleotidyltransferase (CCA-adding enzyme)
LAQGPALDSKGLALDGSGIMAALGIGPSPKVGQATRFLLEKVLDEPALNHPEKLSELLQDWARSHPS